MAGRLLQVLQGLLAERHGHLIAPLRGVLDDQVVEGAQPRWDLVAALLRSGRRTAVLLLDCTDKASVRMRSTLWKPTQHFPGRLGNLGNVSGVL